MSVERRVKPANDIRICHKCRHINVDRLKKQLEEMAPDSRIRVGCKSYCGPCDRYAFIYINGRYVTGETEQEALEKARKYVKKPHTS
ncbi:hypothetical protein PRECH8_27940 [Insulibacter thermoxylanivorax]|jgi:uncharacterized protein YuzB (UPF0349 family)|uniref:DUF1450 domain-containing protein n=1 Tax=Insulibacter thermoxylanivorax TaxID=2749268 RepID=A0A916QI98_9BACL|nr:DUF1450 domain-containing protein [Insulibacter thermoxylanivorax]GFR39498.1 hypothetical protein PRECH8_27940 [Insulibacter thermoxylanivorax]